MINHTTLIDELVASCVLNDEEEADYRDLNEPKSGKLIKDILKKGKDECSKFISILEKSDYSSLQEMLHLIRKYRKRFLILLENLQTEILKPFLHYLVAGDRIE